MQQLLKLEDGRDSLRPNAHVHERQIRQHTVGVALEAIA